MNAGIRSFLKEWVIPQGYLHFFNNVRKKHLSVYEKAILARNARFHNMYSGRRCFVIGNGPSLNKQDLTSLGGETTIVMNLFFRHPIIDVWQPTFYCAAEPPTGGYKNEQIIQVMKEGISKLSPQAFFIPLITKRLSDHYGIHPPEKTYYLKMDGTMILDNTLDLTKTIPGAPDTAVMGIMIALALGCSPIYLLGLDYDWLSHRSLYRHFYDENDPIETREDLKKYSYLQYMKIGMRVWGTHEALSHLALRRKQKIYNASEGGFLDVYPEISLNDALK